MNRSLLKRQLPRRLRARAAEQIVRSARATIFLDVREIDGYFSGFAVPADDCRRGRTAVPHIIGGALPCFCNRDPNHSSRNERLPPQRRGRGGIGPCDDPSRQLEM
jgi:hypothetical protein